jgi:hypothetical protein
MPQKFPRLPAHCTTAEQPHFTPGASTARQRRCRAQAVETRLLAAETG